jgi:hypothetical protein
MAIEKVVKISVDQGQAAGGLEKFVNGLEKTESKTQSLRTELRQLREQLAQLPEGSAEFNEIAQRAGEVSDKIGDISARVKNLGSDTKNIDAVVQGAQTLSGAFSVASSASALLGDENKDLQEQMLKVEAAIGLTVGIQSIANALQKESALSIGLSNVATKIQIGLQTAYATVVGVSTGAMKAFRLALIATGVGALVVGLGMLIANFEKVKTAVLNFIPGLASVGEFVGNLVENFTDFIGVTSESERALEAFKENAEKSLALNKKFIQEQGDTLDEFTKKKIDAKNRYLEAVKEEGANEKALANRLNREIAAIEKERNDERDKKRKEQAEKEKAESDKREQEAKNKRKSELDKINASAKEIEDVLAESEKRKREVLAEGQKILQDLELAKETPAQKLKREYDEKLAILNEANLSTLQLTADYNVRVLQLEKEGNDQLIEQAQDLARRQAEVDEASQQARRSALDTSLNILSQFAGRNKTLALGILAVQKGLAIADVVVGASKGIGVQSAALATANTAALATPLAIATFGASAAPVIAANTAVFTKGVAATKISAATSIASILASGLQGAKSITGGGAGAGSASGGGTGSTPPQFNIVGQNPNNQLAQSIANRQQQPIEAFVVSGNVTNAQSLDRNRIEGATFN